jgi:hypothetical protein
MTTPSHFFEKLQKLQAWDIEWHTMHHIVYESTKLTSLPLLTTKKKNQGRDSLLCGSHNFLFSQNCWCNVSHTTFALATTHF